MRDFPIRKNLRLPKASYLGRQSYFVTFCSFERQPVFRDVQLSEWLKGLLHAECFRLRFCLHAYCLMPDHIHFLAEGLQEGCDLLRLVKSLKIKSSRIHAVRFARVLWQRGFYEHVLRASDSIENVAWYIWLNPVRKGIVERPENYPFLGSFSGLQMPSEWSKAEWRPPWKIVIKVYVATNQRPASEGGPYDTVIRRRVSRSKWG